MTYKSRPMSTIPESSEFSCGLGSWRPKWLQGLASTKMFMFMFGLLGIIQGASFTYMIASVTTLEKRYAFGSTLTGIILISDNIPELTLSPLFGYLANRVHRPRMIGYSMLVVGLGNLLGAVPYFIYGPGTHLLNSNNPQSNPNNYNNNTSVEFCDQNRYDGDVCYDSEGAVTSNTIWPAFIILCLSSFFNGVGYVAFYTIGIPFIDDSVKKKNSPLYLSTAAALRLCGPTIGFMLSSYCLTLYEDPSISPGIERTDPRWIGAWWIGFIVVGGGIVLCSIPMFLFPNNFRSKKNIYRQSNGKPLIPATNSIDKNIGVWKRTKRLLLNPIFVCYMMGTTTRLFAVLGYMTFKAKYIESEYKTSASKANLFSGIVGIVPTATGIFLGGAFITKFLPGPKVLTSLITIVEIFGAMGMLSALFLGCPQSQFAGTLHDTHLEMQSMCNDNCFCSEKIFQPICSSDNITNYFSPCFAGCRSNSITQLTNTTNKYSNCNCLDGPAIDGYCKTDCGNNFHIYITLLGISNIVGNLAKTGNNIISFRIVNEEDKSFAIGLMTGFMCLFTFIPYPLIYGAVVDASCLIWESTCGHRGNCWAYDTYKLRRNLHGLTLTLYFIGSVFDVIVIFLSPRIKNLYNDVTDDQELQSSPIDRKLSSSIDRQLSTTLD